MASRKETAKRPEELAIGEQRGEAKYEEYRVARKLFKTLIALSKHRI